METKIARLFPVKAHFPYSLGDAIEWKQLLNNLSYITPLNPLLARGRDRLETIVISSKKWENMKYPTR
ncbi:MAG: hypothetical protein ACK5P2_12655 [Pseudanabaena sp.]